jgi:hypothetical protein
MYKKIYKEDENDKTQDVIKELIVTKWSGDEPGKILALFKGVIFANTDAAKKFLKKLDDYSSGLNIEDFK